MGKETVIRKYNYHKLTYGKGNCHLIPNDPGVPDWKGITVTLQNYWFGDEIKIINPTLGRGLDS